MTNQQKTKILHQLAFKPKQRLELFRQLSFAEQQEVVNRLSAPVARSIAVAMPESELVSLLEKLDPDEATDLLRLLSPKMRDHVLRQLSDELKATADKLLEFDPETAAGLMTLDYIQVEISDRIEEVVEKFKKHEQRTGRLPAVLVMRDSKLAGSLPVHELILGKPTDKVSAYVKKAHTVHHETKQRKVMELFRAHPHDKVVVLNNDKSVLGVIYSDDVLKIMNEARSASLYEFAGISAEESVLDSYKKKIKHRYRWLIVNLGTAFLAAFVVGQFESTIAQYVLLAVYMPVVAGMGGNAATQTLAVVVRGIALKQISLRTAWRTLKNELGASFFNGVINGLLVAVIVGVVNRDAKMAAVLALAMVVNLLVAGFFGTMIPLVMARLGKDPAASATVFITTATDMLGFLVFLSLGKLILG